MVMKLFKDQEQINKMYRLCSVISFVMIILYFLDIIFLGTGVLTRVGSFSSRILLFCLAGLFSLPLLFRNLLNLIKNKYVVCVVLFVLWVAICAVRGLVGENRTDIIKSDVFGYLNFCLLPTMLCVVNTRKRQKFLMGTITAASFIMAIFTVVLSYFVYLPNSVAVYAWLQETGLCGITVLDGYTARVFFNTASRYFLVAFVFSLYFLYQSNTKKKDVLFTCLMAFFMVAIFLSYARAFYAGSVIAVAVILLLLLLYRDKKIKKVFCSVIAAAVMMVCAVSVIGVTQHTNLVTNAVYRVLLSFETMPTEPGTTPTESGTTPTEPGTTPTEPGTTPTEPGTTPTKPEATAPITQDSEMYGMMNRQEKLDALHLAIMKSPIIGNGLGAAVDVHNGYVEYTYQDILNKMGVVGLLLFLSPFILQSWSLFVKRRRSGSNADREIGMFEIVTYSAIAYFLFITYFNPSMNTTVGIAIYLFSMVVINGEDERFLISDKEKSS